MVGKWICFFGWPIFRGYVSFREGKLYFSYWIWNPKSLFRLAIGWVRQWSPKRNGDVSTMHMYTSSFFCLAVGWQSPDWLVRVQKNDGGHGHFEGHPGENDQCLESTRDIFTKSVSFVLLFEFWHFLYSRHGLRVWVVPQLVLPEGGI